MYSERNIMKQKLRKEIKKEDTWDLTYIFKDEEEFNKSIKEAKGDIKKLLTLKVNY